MSGAPNIAEALASVPEHMKDYVREELEARSTEAARVADLVVEGIRSTFTPEELTGEERENLEKNLVDMRDVLIDVFFAACSWQGRRLLSKVIEKPKPTEIN